MANTRETISDQEIIDKIISYTLEELEEDEVTNIIDYALFNNTGLQKVIFPNATTVGSYAFAGCSALEEVGLQNIKSISSYTFSSCGHLEKITAPNVSSINSYGFTSCTKLKEFISEASSFSLSNNCFYNCESLRHLVINANTVASVYSGNTNDSSLYQSAIWYKEGAVYVKEDLIDSYKNHTYWGRFIIAPISDYPLATFDSITDSWEEIFASELDGSYKTKYAIGDTKALDLGTLGVHKMQIAAFDADTLSDDSGKAKITWISTDLLTTMQYDRISNGWLNSNIRAYLRNTVMPLIPEVVSNAIVEVVKRQSEYKDGAMSKDGQTYDTLWIPSYKEVGLGTTYETVGYTYAQLFPGASARAKYYNMNDYSYWTRSVASANNYAYVVSSGSGSTASYNSTGIGVCLCFCT